MIQQSKPPLTQQEHTRLLLRIAILEDMVAYLLGETDPTEAQHFTSAIRKAEKIINTSQQVARDCIKQLTTQKEEEHSK